MHNCSIWSSPYPMCVENKLKGLTACTEISIVIPVSLGLERCTSLLCLLHLLWMKTDLPWHALLFPINAKVWPCLGSGGSEQKFG